jgi:hypothetical protein
MGWKRRHWPKHLAIIRRAVRTEGRYGSLASILTCQRHVRLNRNLGHGWQCTVSAPFRVVSINIVEGWSRDISTDVAEELRRRCDLQTREVHSTILERYETASPRQLTLRLSS